MGNEKQRVIPAHYSWNSSIFTRGVIDPIKRKLGWVDENERPVSLKESATGQEWDRIKDTAKGTGKLVATGLAFSNPVTASSTMAPLITGSQAYFMTEGLKDAYDRVTSPNKTAADGAMVALDIAGAVPAFSAVRNGYRFVKPAVKSGVLKVVDPHKTIYTNPKDAQRAASLYHTNYTVGDKNLSVEDLESTQWYRKPKSWDDKGVSGFMTPANNRATILRPEDSNTWAHEGRHQLDADIRDVDFDEFNSFSLDEGFSGKDLPAITVKPNEYNLLNQVYTKDVPLAEKVATNSENRFQLWNDLYRNLRRVPSIEELNQFILNQNRFQLYRDMLFGNGYIDHRTRMNALFHPERVKNVMIEVKRNGGIVKRVESGKSGIHIKPENRGKFTALKKRTGKSSTWYKEHGTPAQKKMAVFALNAKKWKHK